MIEENNYTKSYSVIAAKMKLYIYIKNSLKENKYILFPNAFFFTQKKNPSIGAYAKKCVQSNIKAKISVSRKNNEFKTK